uniref:Glutamyl-tRNA reductase n=1 Tax=Pseudictyota dubia TaxID=2749911 RepID=A0A6U2B9Q2_9STRA|mmetsp:Transcript_18655/g.34555  ORF Transcript_18655/g.34555 Transcript_18655/m.34555 type:complete len:544 (+) Transcript_18655:231-1862(+)
MKFGTTTLAAALALAFASSSAEAFTAPAAFAPSAAAAKTSAGNKAVASTAAARRSALFVASQEVEEIAQAPTTTKRTREERLAAASKGLQVHVVGLSIHHAQVEVREKLAVPEPDWNAASAAIVSSSEGAVAEAAVLSTCNRFEVYYAASDPREAMAAVTKYLADRSGLPVSTLRSNLFMLSGDDAVWHIMRVAGGLDSLVVGEGQILSQVRQCHLHSIEEDGSGGKVLSRMLNNAVAAGKRVRSETNISKGSVSISSAAVELSEMLCQDDLNLPFSEARLTAVGAGKMTRLLINHLTGRGLEKITILNRSMARPKELQEQFPDVEIECKLMDDLWDVVGRSDIVFTATSSEDYIIDEQRLEENGMAGGRPLMLVDISVPRNIATDCKEVPNVSAYNVDDLKAVVARNTAMRQREMIEAESLLREEAASFCGWRDSLSAIPTINQLQEKAANIRRAEMDKCARKLSQNENMSEKELEAVERLSRGIVNKLLHGPMSHLRRHEDAGSRRAAVQELSAMFQLEDGEDKNGRGRNNGKANGRGRRK